VVFDGTNGTPLAWIYMMDMCSNKSDRSLKRLFGMTFMINYHRIRAQNTGDACFPRLAGFLAALKKEVFRQSTTLILTIPDVVVCDGAVSLLGSKHGASKRKSRSVISPKPVLNLISAGGWQ
jgi:hypothetical protein